MERTVIFRDRQTVTPEDLSNPQEFTKASLDHIVGKAIEPGRRFTGFVVAATSATVVTVAEGLLFYDGAVFGRDDPGGVDLDLLGLKPDLQQKVVAIVAWPQTVEIDPQDRDFEVDAENEVFEPDSVPMERRRQARLEAVGGVESVAPQPPQIDGTSVVVAYVTMGPGGIISIARNVAKELQPLSGVREDVAGLKTFEQETRPQVSTLRSDLARLAADSAANGDKELLFQVAGDIASVKARLDIPDTYVGYRALPFLDDSQSDTADGDYAARIDEGLRFPFADDATIALALLNPNQPSAKVSANGLLLPTYTKAERRITKGDNGTLSLAEYSNLENRSLVKLAMSRERIRYGGDFEVTMGSSWWKGGTFTDRANGSIRGVFERQGETFQVYETGRVDQDGHKILRLAKFWLDSVATPYWSRQVTEDVALGYAHVETYLNTQDRWIVALGPHMKGKPAIGSITVGVCETYRGEPDLERIVAMTTVQAADVTLVGQSGAFPEIPIEPTFLENGKRYGYFIITQHAFQIGVADAQGGDTSGVTGQYFYGMNGGVWIAEPNFHLLWRDYTAVFPKSSVDVDLQPLQLLDGIQMIDVLHEGVVPGSTDLIYSVHVGGAWRALDEADPDILTNPTSLLPFRVTFLGTPDVMPGIRLPGSSATVSRLALAAVHPSVEKELGAATDTIVVRARMRNFDEAHHTMALKIDRGGVIETPDTVVSVTHPDGVVEHLATFNLAASTTDYRSIVEMATDSAFRPFTVAELIEIAE